MEATPQQEIHLWLFIRLGLICAVINTRQLQVLTLRRCLWGGEGKGGTGAEGAVGLPSTALQTTSLKKKQSN